MSRHYLMKLGVAIAALSLLVVVGCGDDDDPVSSGPMTDIYQQGYVALLNNNQLEFYIEYWDLSFSGLYPDSVTVGGTMTDTYLDSWYWTPDDNYYAADDYRIPNDSSHASGDTIECVTYYAGQAIASSITLLHRDNDRPVIQVPPNDNDTVLIGEPVTVIWDEIPSADFYGIAYSYHRDSLGLNVYSQFRTNVTDTQLVIPGAMIQDNGYVEVSVYGYTGPMPDSGVFATNPSSGRMIGALWSYTYSTSRRVYVGTGAPDGANPVPPTEAPEDPRNLLRQLMNLPPRDFDRE
ncbi:hypothetical protein GF420_12425 [candidate division GN15 bacterium]|nr:hypothetical protein [candidate division GN15 bacterium]